MKIIVTADDFAYDISRNHAIIEALNSKLCSQASLMVNMDACDNAVELATDNGHKNRIALHINLTVGSPITERIKHIPEVCTDGKFNGSFHHNIWKRFSTRYIELVSQEIEAQIIRFFDYGFTMRHLDSHHWIQLDRKVSCVLDKLMERYKFHSYRRSENITLLSDWQIFKKCLWYRHISVYIKYYDRFLAPSKVCYTTTDFVGRIQNLNKSRLVKKGENDDNLTIEFITHPIYKEGILYDKGVGPLADMIGPLLKDGHSFITYNDLR